MNTDGDGNQVIADAGACQFCADGSDLVFIYFCVLDEVQGAMVACRMDIWRKWSVLAVGLGRWSARCKPVTVLATSDHGVHDRIHDTDEPEDMTEPWMVGRLGLR